jgi:hypothetical protein
MKQDKLVLKMYEACLSHDSAKIAELRKKEFEKIFKHKERGFVFTPKWTVINV